MGNSEILSFTTVQTSPTEPTSGFVQRKKGRLSPVLSIPAVRLDQAAPSTLHNAFKSKEMRSWILAAHPLGGGLLHTTSQLPSFPQRL